MVIIWCNVVIVVSGGQIIEVMVFIGICLVVEIVLGLQGNFCVLFGGEMSVDDCQVCDSVVGG